MHGSRKVTLGSAMIDQAAHVLVRLAPRSPGEADDEHDSGKERFEMSNNRCKLIRTIIGACCLCGMPHIAAGQSNVAAPGAAGSVPEGPAGMVWVPAGEFTMGWDGPEARYDEKPAHRVSVEGYWIDATEVTNGQFRAFIEATGYVTTAERPTDWETIKIQLPPGTPKPSAEVLQPGSLVFTPPDHAVDLRDFSQWWTWTHGANWRHPEGQGSSIAKKADYPVVHVSWEDAAAYAKWAGKRLPTEAEWEHAARYGQDGRRFTWGDEFLPGNTHMANIWQGTFPHRNTGGDGFRYAAPVKSFPPNSIEIYDMAGNVWEWTADQFNPGDYARRVEALEGGTCCSNPTGPVTTADPRNPYAKDSRVQKGGSYLCHADYCESYRPSAKMASPPDTGMSHLGFRCVMTPRPKSSGVDSRRRSASIRPAAPTTEVNGAWPSPAR